MKEPNEIKDKDYSKGETDMTQEQPKKSPRIPDRTPESLLPSPGSQFPNGNPLEGAFQQYEAIRKALKDPTVKWVIPEIKI